MPEKWTFYLARHGETEWNRQGLLQGHTDIPLNAKGIEQAQNLGSILTSTPFHCAFSSDLTRAKETAQHIIGSRAIPLTFHTLLRERSYGQLEGMALADFQSRIRPFLLSQAAQDKAVYLSTAWQAGVETASSLYNRLIQFFHATSLSKPPGVYLVVSHGGVLNAVLDHLQFEPHLRWQTDNCAYLCLEWDQHSLNIVEMQSTRQIRR